VQSRARDFADGFVFAKQVKLCRLSSQLADSRRFGSSLFANFDVLPSNKAECSRNRDMFHSGFPVQRSTTLKYFPVQPTQIPPVRSVHQQKPVSPPINAPSPSQNPPVLSPPPSSQPPWWTQKDL
jgi:hypothetical protein